MSSCFISDDSIPLYGNDDEDSISETAAAAVGDQKIVTLPLSIIALLLCPLSGIPALVLSGFYLLTTSTNSYV